MKLFRWFRKKVITISVVVFLTPILLIACSSNTEPKKDPNEFHEVDSFYTLENIDVWNWKIKQTKEEVEQEDIELSKKYPSYNINNSYKNYEVKSWDDEKSKSIDIQPTYQEAEQVYIYLAGGPSILDDEIKIGELIKFYKKNKMIIPTTGRDRSGLFWNSYTLSSWFQEGIEVLKKEDLARTKVWFFRQGQYELIDLLKSINNHEEISIKTIIEIQKMSLINLHKLIKKLHDDGKKVILKGLSYGGSLLYAYLSRYGVNDADAMIIASGAINKSAPLLRNKIVIGRNDKGVYRKLAEDNRYFKCYESKEELLADKAFNTNYWFNHSNPIRHNRRYGKFDQNFPMRIFLKMQASINAMIDIKKIANLSLDNVVILYGRDDLVVLNKGEVNDNSIKLLEESNTPFIWMEDGDHSLRAKYKENTISLSVPFVIHFLSKTAPYPTDTSKKGIYNYHTKYGQDDKVEISPMKGEL